MLNKDKPVEVIFDSEKCTNCGVCASSCPAEYLICENNELKVNLDAPFGCIQCGHCMMSCPNDAIKVRGEGISEEDVFTLDNNPPSYDQLNSLLYSRRSARKFKQQEVPKEIIDKILASAATGAIGIPPYEVKVLVINGRDKVQEFADDLVQSFKKMSKVMPLLRHFMSKNVNKLLKEFVIPLFKMTVEAREKGKDILFYNAPAVVVFYHTEVSEKDDALISATLATTAAEALGLGTCVIGSVPPTINRNSKLKEKYGILKNETVAQVFILGYPESKFSKGIKREFKSVVYTK